MLAIIKGLIFQVIEKRLNFKEKHYISIQHEGTIRDFGLKKNMIIIRNRIMLWYKLRAYDH